MRIFDINGNQIENPNLEEGQLIEATRNLTHTYVVTQEATGHYETVKEYPNGGKDVEWVIDTPEKGHWKTIDEDGQEIETPIEIPDDAPHEIDIEDIENVYEYVLFTESELLDIAKAKLNAQIEDFKQQLRDTDYTVIKILEGVATWDDYKGIKTQRQGWRQSINELEEELAAM